MPALAGIEGDKKLHETARDAKQRCASESKELSLFGPIDIDKKHLTHASQRKHVNSNLLKS